MTLELHGVTVDRGATRACDDVTLTVGAGEVVALLGPSGCGKTSLLRAVAGLEPLAGGRVVLDGVDLAGQPPEQRGIGVMFQDLALFPHLDVAGNVGYGLRTGRVARAARDDRVRELLALVGLEGAASRDVATLSGGERQRVALARAVARAPRLVLLDEPLGALDRRLRGRLADELATLLAGLGVPAIVVTHDHDEAFALATRVAVMRAGRIVQCDAPTAVWSQPVDEWTSDFVGHPVAVPGVLSGERLVTPWGSVAADALGDAATAIREGAAGVDVPVRVVVPRRAVALAGIEPALGSGAAHDSGAATADVGTWRGIVERVRVERDGPVVAVAGRDGHRLWVGVDAKIATGTTLAVRARPERLLVYPA